MSTIIIFTISIQDISNWAIMVGNVRLNFGWVSFEVRLVLFWSGIWYGKLIFLKIILKKILSTSKMSFRYIQFF